MSLPDDLILGATFAALSVGIGVTFTVVTWLEERVERMATTTREPRYAVCPACGHRRPVVAGPSSPAGSTGTATRWRACRPAPAGARWRGPMSKCREKRRKEREAMEAILVEPERATRFEGLPAIFSDAASPYYCTDKFDLRYPWRHGDYAYATDAKILVRVPLSILTIRVREGLPVGHRRPVAEAASYFDPALAFEAEPTPLPDAAEFMPCPGCRGFGEAVHHGHRFECEDCEGAGRVHTLDRCVLGPGFALMSCYVGMLRRHGASVYLPAGPDRSGCPAKLVVGDVEGRVMPVKMPELNVIEPAAAAKGA